MPFRPFTDFLNQGMRNTNRNVGNANMPRYQQGGFVNPYLQPGFGQGAGGGVMGGAQQGGEQYTPGGPGPSGMEEWDPSWHANPGAGLDYPGSWSGGVIPEDEPGSKPWPPIKPPEMINPGNLIQDLIRPINALKPSIPSMEPPGGISLKPSLPGTLRPRPLPPRPNDPLPTGFEWQFVNGEWLPTQTGLEAPETPIYGGGGDPPNFDLNNDGVVDVLDINVAQQGDYDSSFLEQLHNIISGGMGLGGGSVDIPPDYSGGDYFQETQEQPHEVLPQGYEWQYINSEWIPVNVEEDIQGGGAVTPGWGGLTASPMDKTSFEPFDFTGGGGRGGQRAKRLYYPGTSGGFASVGTGIGGGGSSLDELLKGLQG